MKKILKINLKKKLVIFNEPEWYGMKCMFYKSKRDTRRYSRCFLCMKNVGGVELCLTSFITFNFCYNLKLPVSATFTSQVIGLLQETSIWDALAKLFHSRFCVQPIYGTHEFKLAQTPPCV